MGTPITPRWFVVRPRAMATSGVTITISPCCRPDGRC